MYTDQKNISIFQEYHTPRLILNKLTPEVYNHIFNNYDKLEIKRILGLETEEEFLLEENKFKGGYKTYNRSILFFQIIEKESGNIIGSAGFHNWMQEHNRAELGYSLKSDNIKQKGYMSEAVKFILDYGFKEMELLRIEACVGPKNIPSLKIMEKFKFTEEGRLRQHYFINNSFDDSIIFSLLKKEHLLIADK